MDGHSSVKIVLVGDARVGKTGLIQRFIANQAPTNIYLPTGFDKYTATFEAAGYPYFASIWDTSGSPTYDTVRALAYQDTDVFLICFHLGDWYSLHNALTKWYPEVRKASPTAPILLVGCQNDQRFVENLYASFHMVQNSVSGAISPLTSASQDTKRKTVYSEEALDACRQMGAVTYVETCAYNAMTVREAFEIAGLASNGKLAYLQQQQQAQLKKQHKKQHHTDHPHPRSLLTLKHLSLSTSTTNTTLSSGQGSLASSGCSSPGSDCSSSVKIKPSSSASQILTRNKSLFKLRKSKSRSELSNDSGFGVIGPTSHLDDNDLDDKKDKGCAIM